MKSQVRSLLVVAHALLKDVRVAYPGYRGVDRDIDRLSRCAESRGLGFFTLDLPHLDSVLTDGLRCGRLRALGPCCTHVSKQITVPRLFSGLWLRVFDAHSRLLSNPDPTAVAFLRQLSCLGKRVVLECTPRRLNDAIEEYCNVERDTRQPTLGWEFDDLDPDGHGSRLHIRDDLELDLPLLETAGLIQRNQDDELRILCDRYQQIADYVTRRLGAFESVSRSASLFEAGRGTGHRHGPGAVADSSKGWKYSFPRWSAKLDAWFPYDQLGSLPGQSRDFTPLNHELPSRLLAVPKTAKSPRLIAAEPTEHMWAQQAIRHFLVERIDNVFASSYIDFADQSKSRLMARVGSSGGDLATVDLSSASDRLSCWVVERTFRGNPLLLHALHSCRTRYIRYEPGKVRVRTHSLFSDYGPGADVDGCGVAGPNGHVTHRVQSGTPYQSPCGRDITSLPLHSDGRSVSGGFLLKQKKFASQGTAVTFPIQTLVFTIAALASLPEPTMDIGRLIRKNRHKVRVFGDDIIIPKDGYARLRKLLTYLGLKVNEAKSFGDGHFRESCGGDYFMGDDVTPVKPTFPVRDGPQSRMAYVDTSNNFFKKGYWHAANAIESIGIGRIRKFLPVFGRDRGSSGLISFCGDDFSHLSTRWSESLSRTEFRVWSSKARSRRESPGGWPALLQYFTEGRHPEWGKHLLDPYEGNGYNVGRPKVSDGLRWDPLY